MKKLYYFSKAKLQFVEIENYKAKFAVIFAISVVILSFLVFSGYLFISSYSNSGNNIWSLKDENRTLRENLDKMTTQFESINTQMDSLLKVNNQLRIAANLKPLSQDEYKVGIGGGSFDNSIDFLKNPSEEKLNKVLSYVNEVARKVAFEKEQYAEISNKLKENQKLYKAIPAIKPCTGPVGDGFGMRMHPILHIRRMHDGIDIVTNVGTPVHVTGDGVVEFVGHRGGYGLAVEVNHGFGYSTLYAHLSKVLVRDHQKVHRGQVIAKTGDSGLSTGPHLHYEVHHNGIALNPAGFFFGNFGLFQLASKN